MIAASRLPLLIISSYTSEMDFLNNEMRVRFEGKGERKIPKWWIQPDLLWWGMTDTEQNRLVAAHQEEISLLRSNSRKKKTIQPVTNLKVIYPELKNSSDWNRLSDEGKFLSISFRFRLCMLLIIRYQTTHFYNIRKGRV
jgi:hypothetical protein